jgi:hypothetical protein
MIKTQNNFLIEYNYTISAILRDISISRHQENDNAHNNGKPEQLP